MKSVKDRLKEVMAAHRYNILAVSEATGIPSPRMYKWFKEGTNPKAEDCEKLEKWMSSLEKPLIVEPVAEGQKKDPLLGDLVVSTRKLSDSNLINARNIERLITLLEVSFGKLHKSSEGDTLPDELEDLKGTLKGAVKKDTPQKRGK